MDRSGEFQTFRDKKRERKRKNEFRTKDARENIANMSIEASKLNAEREKKRNPEDMVSERVEISDVLRRILKEDKREGGLPTLEKYLRWLMEKVDQKSEGDLVLDWKKECDSNSDKVGGPGGQNVNKVDSAWSMKHKYLLIRVKMGQSRDQFRNREDAEVKMANLVNKHVDIWLEKLVSSTDDWKKIVFETLRDEYVDLLERKMIQGESRMVDLQNVCSKVLDLEKNKTSQVT